jgi:peptidoglycan/LPS O-acetylase OafA/YrhL
MSVPAGSFSEAPAGTSGVPRAVWDQMKNSLCAHADSWIVFHLTPNNTPHLFFQSGHSERFPIIFLIGALFYVNKKYIPLDFRILLGLVLLTIISKDQVRVLEIMKYVLFSYSVIYISLLERFKLPNIDKYRDFSYGIYIYAFPIQQIYAYLFDKADPYLMFFVVTTLSSVCAYFPWHYIEKPALRLKSKKVFE